MAHEKQKPKQEEEEGGEGAPLWIISFADMMSLLMAFFVMLSTFSGFGPAEAEKLQRTAKAVLAPNYYGGWYTPYPRAAMGAQAMAAGQLEKGSERPTLEETQGKGLLKETPAGDFRSRKIFLIESRAVFWGAGTALSPEGRDFLNTLASFVSKMPDRLVICEDGPGPDDQQGGTPIAKDGDWEGLPPAKQSRWGPEPGLVRAAWVLNYLTGRGISKDRCSIAARGMSPDRSFQTQRMLEIALLSASVYR
jgi:outer membrane protein OmpA-like peptidoglycan-associated protein